MSATVRAARLEDIPRIIALCRAVYPDSPPWTEEQLASHQRVFPEGQLVAISDGRLVGLAASLVVLWDDYAFDSSWRDFTAGGTFTNHDPARGRTLYGAEVMVDRSVQGQGLGSLLYDARWELARALRLLRIRAGARLRGYHRFAERMSAEAYVDAVVRGELRDPTLSFQLHRGFEVLGVISGYLRHDPDSRGYAAVIERINPDVARPEDLVGRDPRSPRRDAAAR